MYIVIAILFIIILILYYNCNENFGDLLPLTKTLVGHQFFAPTVNIVGESDILHNEDPNYWFRYGDKEKTPYNHKSSFDFNYLKYCKNKKCVNSRCIFTSLDECQKKCKNGCRGCDGTNYSYMCDLQ